MTEELALRNVRRMCDIIDNQMYEIGKLIGQTLNNDEARKMETIIITVLGHDVANEIWEHKINWEEVKWE